ncbi:MAG: glycosyltransferase involved in cell wall biosynthesis [Chitinophagales bacterium]|jgi:glycosyltransferase involved in cell wall biosynthesis
MSLPKIVIFVDWFVPAYKAGGPISSIRNLCLALSKSYDIYVVTGDKDLGDTEPLPGITTNIWTHMLDVQVKFLNKRQQTFDSYKKILEEVKPEAVHLNSLFSQSFTLLPLRVLKNIDTKVIISPRGMFGPASLAIKPLKKKLFFRYVKLFGVFKNIIWHATSEIEKNEILHVLPKANVLIANNFPFLPVKNESYLAKEAGSIRMICVGRVARIKNIDFLIRVLQKVTSNVYVRIVGPVEDEAYYTECKKLAESLSDHIELEFIEGVNFIQLNKLYDDTHLFISPTKNENFGHGIAEAFGHGCPVIISNATPWRNLKDKGVGADLKLEEERFVDEIEHYARIKASEFMQIRNSARFFAENIISSGDLKKGYQIIYGN